MANKIILKRANTTGKIPLVTDIDLGELAINTFDGRLFAKKNDGTASIIDLKQNDPIRVLGDATSAYAWDQSTYTSNVTMTLNTVNANVGTYGGKAGGVIEIPIFTVNEKGLVTSVTTTTYSASGDLGTMASQNANAVAITGGTIDGTAIGQTTRAAGNFTDIDTTGNVTIGGKLFSNDLTATSITVDGDTVISGNLTVQGVTTTVNSNTVSVGDLNIQLAKDALNAAQANGGGITVVGPATPATITYASLDDSWNLNKALNGVSADFTGNVGADFGDFSSNVSVGDSLSVANSATIGNLTITGTTSLGSITTSGVSAGRIVYGGTGGVLTSESALTYNATSNTLTLTNLVGTTANLSNTLDVSGVTTLKSTVNLTDISTYTVANYTTGAFTVAGDASFAKSIQVQTDIRAAGTIYKAGLEVLNTGDTIDGGSY